MHMAVAGCGKVVGIQLSCHQCSLVTKVIGQVERWFGSHLFASLLFAVLRMLFYRLMMDDDG